MNARRDPAWPRRFQLFRHQDVSGVSGVGVVAFGTIYPSGLVTLCWLGEHPSVTTWGSLTDLLAVHGHDGATEIVWIDEPDPSEARATRTMEYAC